MSGRTLASWRARLCFAGVARTLAAAVVAGVPAPAQARVFFAFGGVPCCGYWGAYPYYPSPYYYGPPAAYYYGPPAYPAPAAPAPSAYAPPAAAPYASPAPGTTPAITYTSKPAFTNAAGQTCREYRTSDASGRAAYGTACRAADGQWRVVN